MINWSSGILTMKGEGGMKRRFYCCFAGILFVAICAQGAVEDDTPPTAPSNLRASAAGNSQIDLSWDAASDGESGVSSYNVYRNGSKVAGSNGTSCSDQGLEADTEYKYQVAAVNGAGLEGDKSGETSATTESGDDPNPNPTPNPEGVTVSAEKKLLGGGMKPVYKVEDGTVHMIYTRGDKKVYYQRLTTSGKKIGKEEQVPGIGWMTTGFNAGIQNPSLACRDGKTVIASGDNQGYIGIAVRDNGQWVHSETIDQSTDKPQDRYRRIADPSVGITSDGTAHVTAMKYGRNDPVMHYIIDPSDYSVKSSAIDNSGEHSIGRIMVTSDDVVHYTYVHHIRQVYYRQYKNGSWTDKMNVKSQGGYTGHADMDIRGNTVYALFSQGSPQYVALAKVDRQSRSKKVLKVVDDDGELFSQSIAVNKDHGTIHVTYWHRTGDFNAAELQYIYSKDDGQSWSSPKTITKKEANFGKAWITYVGDNKSIIIYSDRRKNVYMRTFDEGGTTACGPGRRGDTPAAN
jgi:chitodextrinase